MHHHFFSKWKKGLNAFPLSGDVSRGVAMKAVKETRQNAGGVAWLMTDPWWSQCVTAPRLSRNINIKQCTSVAQCNPN